MVPFKVYIGTTLEVDLFKKFQKFNMVVFDKKNQNPLAIDLKTSSLFKPTLFDNLNILIRISFSRAIYARTKERRQSKPSSKLSKKLTAPVTSAPKSTAKSASRFSRTVPCVPSELY
ncbi:hypothetical protein BpHYR1_005553 [Brachionus plicatilis]|uniref:Uncharacterized protein n=1 Tax=Brachionus plicatilis TaxID=10195 RepID=A0A3M7SGI8_BRAPC|nr:hypothetical protein BpHYR1_005553 [Brachionus plicatilis]